MFIKSYNSFFNCTLLWILRTRIHYRLKFYSKFKNDSIIKYFMNKNFTKMIENCDFEKRLGFCKLNKSEDISQIKDIIFEFDKVHSYMFVKYADILFLTPIICFLSILLNILTFKISFKYKDIQTKKKEVQHKMFDDLKLIAALNIAYCVLSLLGILSECVQHNGKYCPYFRTNLILQ